MPAKKSTSKTAKKGTRTAAKKGTSKAAAKKSGRKSTAKKTSAGKSAAKKSTAKKSGVKKSGTKKTAAKKSGGRKFGRKASKKVGRVMHEFKDGELKSGPGGKGGPVKSREQAIAIGISEARAEGDKVPERASGAKKSGRKKASSDSSNASS